MIKQRINTSVTVSDKVLSDASLCEVFPISSGVPGNNDKCACARSLDLGSLKPHALILYDDIYRESFYAFSLMARDTRFRGRAQSRSGNEKRISLRSNAHSGYFADVYILSALCSSLPRARITLRGIISGESAGAQRRVAKRRNRLDDAFSHVW